MTCLDCGQERTSRYQTLLCDECFDKQNEYLRSVAIDVETYDESREKFLLRKSKELGLNYTVKDIHNMIRAGMTDNLILKTKSDSVWTMGSERSKALPMSYHQMGL